MSGTAVAAYIRVSSKAQTYDMQRAAIERAATARGHAIATWYAEKMSARTMARPELTRLRADARAGLVRAVYVFRLDRLTRSGIRDLLTLVEELRGHGCRLIPVSDGFDLEGPAAEVVLAVMAWASKMERLAINERIAAARARLAAEGRPWGRPPAATAEQAARVRQLAAEGRTVRQIAMGLGIKRGTVGRVLSRKGCYGSAPEGPRQTAAAGADATLTQ